MSVNAPFNPVNAALAALAEDKNLNPSFQRYARRSVDPVDAYYERFDDAGPEAADQVEDRHTAAVQRSW